MRMINLVGLSTLAMLAACNDAATPRDAATSDPAASAAAGGASVSSAAVVTPSAAQAAAPAPEPTCDAYRSDLTDGDIVRIYYAAAGLTPPFEKWAEKAIPYGDLGVSQEEAWKRANAQVTAQWNAVKDVRCIAIRASADIGTYDDARGGLPVGALRPDTYYSFSDGGDSVQVRLTNAEAAGLWKLSRDRAMALTVNYALGGAAAVLRVKVMSARPSDRVGVIEGKVVGYDIVPVNRSMPQQTVAVSD